MLFSLAFGGMATSLFPGWLLDKAAEFLGMPSKYEVVPYLTALFAWVICGIVIAERAEFYDTVPAYFYIKGELETPSLMMKLKQLSFLLNGSLNGRWYPLTEIRKLPQEQRKPYLFSFARRVSGGTE
jgi:hypothetical protein